MKEYLKIFILEESETVKFDFNLWSYYEKFDCKNQRNKFLISKQS